jgi:monothiol glutaredoxin
MKGTPGWPKCGFSRLTVQILELNGVEDYKALDVLEDDELREGIKKFSQWPTIPQVYIKGEFIGGADIMRSLHESGELKEMLEKHGIAKDE